MKHDEQVTLGCQIVFSPSDDAPKDSQNMFYHLSQLALTDTNFQEVEPSAEDEQLAPGKSGLNRMWQ